MARRRRAKGEANTGDLLRALQSDNYRSDKELASILGVYPAWVYKRQQILRKRGYIKASRAVINPEKVGLEMLAFIALRLKDSTPGRGEKTALWISKFNNVQEIHHVTGDFDILVKIRAKTNRDQRAFLKHLDADQNIERPLTLMVTQTIMETSEVYISDNDGIFIEADISKNGEFDGDSKQVDGEEFSSEADS